MEAIRHQLISSSLSRYLQCFIRVGWLFGIFFHQQQQYINLNPPGPWEVPDFRTSSPVTKKWPFWVRHRDVEVGCKVWWLHWQHRIHTRQKKRGYHGYRKWWLEHVYLLSNIAIQISGVQPVTWFPWDFSPTHKKKAPDFCWGDPTLQLWNVATFLAIDMTALVQVVCLLQLLVWVCHLGNATQFNLALPTALMVLLKLMASSRSTATLLDASCRRRTGPNVRVFCQGHVPQSGVEGKNWLLGHWANCVVGWRLWITWVLRKH